MQGSIYFDDVFSEFEKNLETPKTKHPYTIDQGLSKVRSKSTTLPLDQAELRLYKAIDMAG